MTDKLIVLTTAGDKKEAEDIAWALLERKLAACVNIITLESVYRWKGEIEKNPEYQLVIKTTAAAYERVRDAIKELNSYQIPECIQLPILAGSEAYLHWIQDSVE
jgi:periplasmic divalent cation tolerance protein